MHQVARTVGFYSRLVTTITEEDRYLRRILALLDSARPFENLTQSDSRQRLVVLVTQPALPVGG
ncbi:hypothetical protein KE639_04160 [Streptomyces sp. V17-9]|nr:hypothetical protein KE639_04160 [Streptomyces sp. V17-9]